MPDQTVSNVSPVQESGLQEESVFVFFCWLDTVIIIISFYKGRKLGLGPVYHFALGTDRANDSIIIAGGNRRTRGKPA